ncbi:MAG TPA: adenylate/guanylate cyclase domain-containing protein, partial [Actinomycetota bacterium]|nr:adenylate/guanylate cyclase domain-containing protein [Actinomycetota bacterium]
MTPRGAASAGTTCPACGVETPAEARFCPACGQRLLGGVEERRVVTVLFADLVDSTRLVTALDPEAARDLLTETFRRLAAEVRRFGGTLEKYIGDAIFAVFGFPTGHDDDDARGVRAALAMRDIVKTAETALGDLPLHLRIGLDTGEVAGGAGSGDLRVTGPAMHTAAVLEDLHWATPDLLEVASTLVTDGCRAQGQLAYLGISRPELPGLPAWLLRTGTQRIDLDPLGERPAAELLVSVLGDRAEPDLAGQVFDATKGNPLFVKELAIALREAGPAAPGQPSLPIPDSLQALVAARLDRLPLSAKRVLCRAAVVGKWFSHAALAAMAQPGDGELDADLDRLTRTGLIERLPERLAGGQERFAFHHSLFRDVAYGILPKAGRSELHRRLADWLAGAPGEEPSLPEVVAYHLVQAVRLAGEVRAPTAEDRELAARAVAACQRAARRLRDQEALAGAARVLDDALGLAGLAGTGAEEVAELRLERGTVRGATGDLPGALADLGPATGSSRPAVRARAWTELSNLHGMFGQFAESAAAADRAIVEAVEAGDPALNAQATRAKAHVPYVAGDLAEAVRLL